MNGGKSPNVFDEIIYRIRGRLNAAMTDSEEAAVGGDASARENAAADSIENLVAELEELREDSCLPPFTSVNGGSDPLHVVGRHRVDRETGLVFVQLRVYNATACTIAQPLHFSVSLSPGLFFRDDSGGSYSFGDRLTPGNCVCWSFSLCTRGEEYIPFENLCFLVQVDIESLEVDAELGENAEALLRGDESLVLGKSSGPPSSDAQLGGEAGDGPSSTSITMCCGSYEICPLEFLFPAPDGYLRMPGFRELFSGLPCSTHLAVSLAGWAESISGGPEDITRAMEEAAGAESVPRCAVVPLPAAAQGAADSSFLFIAWALQTPCGNFVAVQMSCIQGVLRTGAFMAPTSSSWQGRLEVRCSNARLLHVLGGESSREKLVDFLTGGLFTCDAGVGVFDATSHRIPGQRGSHKYRGGEETSTYVLPRWRDLKQ